MAEWILDEGYSGCKTARFGDIAVVICPPEQTGDDRWGYQAFDEADEKALSYGEYFESQIGFFSEASTIDYAEKRFGGKKEDGMAATYGTALFSIADVYKDWLEAESKSIRIARDHSEDCIEYHNIMEHADRRLAEMNAMITLTCELFPEYNYREVLADVQEAVRRGQEYAEDEA